NPKEISREILNLVVVKNNQEEISEVRRVAPSELDGYLQGHPEQLAPWLREALEAPSIRAALAM
ncbi:MAG: hypothetical protein ACI38T_02355, partial [Collinsella sp.]